jgi:hypothetical protein
VGLRLAAPASHADLLAAIPMADDPLRCIWAAGLHGWLLPMDGGPRVVLGTLMDIDPLDDDLDLAGILTDDGWITV